MTAMTSSTSILSTRPKATETSPAPPKMSSTAATTKEVPWTLPPHKRYIFRNASVVDPVAAKVHEHCTVSVHKGLIESVEYAKDKEIGGSPQIIESENGTQISEIDLEGKFLCPGLIDCHVHMNAVPGEKSLYAMKSLPPNVIHLRQSHMCQEMLARGFTSARDCGGTSIALKDAIRDGVVSGPRLFVALNQLTQTGGHGDMRNSYNTTTCCGGHVFGSGRLCDGVDECLRVARDQIRLGADFLKIMGGGGISSPTDAIDSVQFTPEEIKTIVSVAKRNKTYVSCHAYTPESIRNAIDNGVTAIEHGNLIDEETANLMAEKNVFLTPTLATYSAMASDRYVTYLPPEGVEKNEAVLHAGLESLRIADKAGITMCFGTDLLGPMCHLQTSEFGLRAQALSAEKILKMATINAAKLLMQEDKLGQIKPGYMADLLVLKSNPLEDILILDQPEKYLLAIMKEGRVHASRWSKVAADIDRTNTIE